MQKIAKNIISVCGHIGTHKYNWQPESERFAIGYRSSVFIYNIAITNFYFNRACFFVENLIYKYGRIYVYGLEKKNDKKFIRRLESLGQVVTTHNWSGGFVTNARVFRGKIKNLKKKFSAILGLSFDYQNYSLPREAKIINLPSIGVVDSNANAETFTYPIPINSSNFGVKRLLSFIFTIKIFKGISKRILSRFKKKLKIISKSKKMNKKRKKKYILGKYFRKLKRKLRVKKRKLKKKLKNWSRKYKKKYRKFKFKSLTLSKKKKERDYINKNGEKWVTLEAAFREYALAEKFKRLPKKKVKKFIQKRLLALEKKRVKYSLPKPKHDIRKPLRESLTLLKEKKANSYMRIGSMIRKREILQKKIARELKKRQGTAKRGKKKLKRKSKTKKNPYRKKKSRYRPNKKWKFKPNRFKYKKKKRNILSRFSKIKKKLFKLAKIKNFKKIFSKEKKFKNPKFVYRFLKKAISKYKLRKIYKFLYKKKKKIIVKRAKIKMSNKYGRRQKTVNNKYQNYYQKNYNNNYHKHRYYDNINKNVYNTNRADQGNRGFNNRPYYNKGNNHYYQKIQTGYRPDAYQKQKTKNDNNYRYYYKDFSYVKKPNKKKRFY